MVSLFPLFFFLPLSSLLLQRYVNHQHSPLSANVRRRAGTFCISSVFSTISFIFPEFSRLSSVRIWGEISVFGGKLNGFNVVAVDNTTSDLIRALKASWVFGGALAAPRFASLA